MPLKTYEEAVEMVKEYANNLSVSVMTKEVHNGTFALIGYFLGNVYGVTGKKIIGDFVIEKHGITYKLINKE